MIVLIHLKEHVILLLANVPVNLVLLEKIAVFQVHEKIFILAMIFQKHNMFWTTDL